MHRFVRTALALGAAGIVAASALPAAPAAADTAIGPRQYFAAAVNGATQDAVLTVVCVGPLATGHPLNDVVAVKQVPPSSTAVGFTGAASRLSVDLTAPAPPSSAARVYHLADFTTYGSQTLDSTLVLPCARNGVVTFTPVAGGTAARAGTVRVTIRNPAF